MMTSVDLGGFLSQEKPLHRLQQASAPSFPLENELMGTHLTGEGYDWVGKASDHFPGSNGTGIPKPF